MPCPASALLENDRLLGMGTEGIHSPTLKIWYNIGICLENGPQNDCKYDMYDAMIKRKTPTRHRRFFFGWNHSSQLASHGGWEIRDGQVSTTRRRLTVGVDEVETSFLRKKWIWSPKICLVEIFRTVAFGYGLIVFGSMVPSSPEKVDGPKNLDQLNAPIPGSTNLK